MASLVNGCVCPFVDDQCLVLRYQLSPQITIPNLHCEPIATNFCYVSVQYVLFVLFVPRWYIRRSLETSISICMSVSCFSVVSPLVFVWFRLIGLVSSINCPLKSVRCSHVIRSKLCRWNYLLTFLFGCRVGNVRAALVSSRHTSIYLICLLMDYRMEFFSCFHVILRSVDHTFGVYPSTCTI